MIIPLAFKSWSGYKEKPVELVFDLGVMEMTCEKLGIEFWQIKDCITKNAYDFSQELLWQAYIRACEKRYKKPEHDRVNAVIWNEHLSKESSALFQHGMTDLFGKIVKAYKNTDKKKVKSNI